jgi:hypothetical protein
MTTLEFRSVELKAEVQDAPKGTRHPAVFLFRVLAAVGFGLAIVLLAS